MDSKSARFIAVIFLLLGVLAAVFSYTYISMLSAIVLGFSAVSIAVVFLILEGILKNQEKTNELLREIRDLHQRTDSSNDSAD